MFELILEFLLDTPGFVPAVIVIILIAAVRIFWISQDQKEQSAEKPKKSFEIKFYPEDSPQRKGARRLGAEADQKALNLIIKSFGKGITDETTRQRTIKANKGDSDGK